MISKHMVFITEQEEAQDKAAAIKECNVMLHGMNRIQQATFRKHFSAGFDSAYKETTTFFQSPELHIQGAVAHGGKQIQGKLKARGQRATRAFLLGEAIASYLVTLRLGINNPDFYAKAPQAAIGQMLAATHQLQSTLSSAQESAPQALAAQLQSMFSLQDNVLHDRILQTFEGILRS
jgi:hypothetical protein